MRSLPAVVALVGIAAALGGCAKTEVAKVTPPPAPPPSVELVKAQEQSRHFLAVSQHLELGGTLYGYMDVDGDVEKMGGMMKHFVTAMSVSNPQLAMFGNQDYSGIFKALGFDDVKAIGYSSVPDGTGFFRNSVFLYTPNGRTGLLAAVGGKPTTFPHLALAGADTDLYIDSDIDASAIYTAFQAVARSIGGQTAANAMDGQLKNIGQSISLSILGLFENLKGNMAMVLRVNDSQTTTIPAGANGPVTIPRFDYVVCVDGIGGIVEPALAHSPIFSADTAGPVHYFNEVKPGAPPATVIFAVDGSTLYMANSREYLDAAMKKPDGLRGTAAFKEAISHVGQEGNGISYLTPHSIKVVKSLGELNKGSKLGQVLELMGTSLTVRDRPVIAVRTNLPDGILIRSYADRSLKQSLVAVAVYNPVTLGLLAAVGMQNRNAAAARAQGMAPVGSRPVAVPMTPEATVKRNLRVLYTLGMIYGRQHHQAAVPYSDFVGPGKSLPSIPAKSGEDYSQLVVESGKPLKVTMANGTVVEYDPPVPKAPAPAVPAGP